MGVMNPSEQEIVLSSNVELLENSSNESSNDLSILVAEDNVGYEILIQLIVGLLVLIFVMKIVFDIFCHSRSSSRSPCWWTTRDTNYQRYDVRNNFRFKREEKRRRIVAQRWQLTKVNLDFIENSEMESKKPFSPDSSFQD